MSKGVRWTAVAVAILLFAFALRFIWATGRRPAVQPSLTQAGAQSAAIDAALSNGMRRLHSLGCIHCHGEQLQGRLIFDDPKIARTYAPNLTLIAAQENDQTLARAIRGGVGSDGRLLIVMRSAEYSQLTDAELADIIAAIRKFPVGGVQTPPSTSGPTARLALKQGKMQTQPARVSEYARDIPPELGPKVTAGRYLAMTHCAECHGPSLGGGEPEPGATAPDLNIVSAYDLPQFTKLLRTGVPLGGRKLRQMDVTAREELSHLSESEIADIHAYLIERARRAE